MAGDQDGLALGRQVAQEPAQPADALGIQTVRRLVQHQDVRVAEQCAGQSEPLTHTHRVAAGAFLRSRWDADEFEQFVGAARRQAGGRGEHT